MRFLRKFMIGWVASVLLLAVLACSVTWNVPETGTGNGGGSGGSGGGAPPGNVSETGRVIDVIDGDTIDVDVNGSVFRIRYVGMNTPERGEVCYSEARQANIALVLNQTVSLVRDVSNTDRFERLLRYVYVGDRNVNADLVVNGWAEAVSYPPDTAQFNNFVALEQEATQAGRGCHPTGIFNDGTYER